MNITVCSLSDQSVFPLNVSADLELENLKAFCEVESGIPAGQIVLAHNGRPLMDDKKTLRDYGVKDGDMLVLQRNERNAPASTQSAAPVPLPTGLRSKILFQNGPNGCFIIRGARCRRRGRRWSAHV